jgi:hypothetical protein
MTPRTKAAARVALGWAIGIGLIGTILLRLGANPDNPGRGFVEGMLFIPFYFPATFLVVWAWLTFVSKKPIDGFYKTGELTQESDQTAEEQIHSGAIVERIGHDSQERDDSKLYLAATTEFDSNRKNQATWAKALALHDGDQERARYEYIRLRAAQFTNVEKRNRLQDYKPSDTRVESAKTTTWPLSKSADGSSKTNAASVHLDNPQRLVKIPVVEILEKAEELGQMEAKQKKSTSKGKVFIDSSFHPNARSDSKRAETSRAVITSEDARRAEAYKKILDPKNYDLIVKSSEWIVVDPRGDIFRFSSLGDFEEYLKSCLS